MAASVLELEEEASDPAAPPATFRQIFALATGFFAQTAAGVVKRILIQGDDHGLLGGLADDDHTQYQLRTQPITTFAGGTLTLTNADAGKFYRCTGATTVEVGDALDLGHSTGFVQDGVGQIEFVATGSMVLESFSAFTSPFKTAGDGARAMVEKTTSTVAVVTGVLVTDFIDHGTLSGLGDDDHAQYELRNSVITDSSAARAVTNADHGQTIVMTGTNPVVTFPTGLVSYFWARYLQGGATQVTFAAGAGATINRISTFATPIKSREQYAEALVSQYATNTFKATGELAFV
jgi:hypothetical protein